MEKSFDPRTIENKWYSRWEADGLFAPSGDGEPYCILLPPPNVTGTLHMGHAFQQTIMDALIRYHRMRGFRALWQGGTDHAGIATQKIVENQLAAQNKTRQDLGRDKFIERVWEWKEESGSTITNQMRRLGASMDWSRERFTMDDGLSAAVKRVFVQWYRDGLLYRGKRLVHWDPVLMTAVSDLEVNNEERDGNLWSIRYPAADGGEGVVVATTRPETMLGDVAVAVHPEDERYAALIGKKLELPLTGREIPVIADDYVDREFGTGAVKITPAHDFNDYKIWERHREELAETPGSGLLCVLSLDGRSIDRPKGLLFVEPTSPDAENGPKEFAEWVQSLAGEGYGDWSKATIAKTFRDFGGGQFAYCLIPKAYRGVDRFQLRKAVLADLEAQGLLVETKKHKLQVPISQRSDAVIEPMLTDQWFLDLTSDTRVDGKAGPGGKKTITEPALNAVRSGEIKFVPENWSTTYTQWLENIQDWCVSRQLWWGHRIPAWYDINGNIYVAESETELRSHYPEILDQNGQIRPELLLKQDEDVLDTWFSSALWPFSTLGWPSHESVRENGKVVANWPQDERYLPSNVLVTGFDIIFFWVARMIMATQYFIGKVPFREVYINAIVRDAEGQKMSKSKGNTIDPLDLIDGITLDALVKKSTGSLLIPQVREKVEKRIRKDYPDGISAVGADALRFTFAALATYGRTINFDLKRAEGYKNFCNKLWNAARFVLMNCENFSVAQDAKLTPKTYAEKWILTRFERMLADVEVQMPLYRFDLVAQSLYEFTWNIYCDWFLEFAKPALGGDNKEFADSTRHTLLFVLEALLRALHPIIPFITEEIWQTIAPMLGKSTASVSTQKYPLAADFSEFADTQSDASIEWLREVLTQVRRIRSEMNIAPGKTIPLLYANGTPNQRDLSQKFNAQIAFLARAESQRWLDTDESEPASASAIVGEMKILIPLAGLIDLDAEKTRLAKEIKRIEGENAKSTAKLANFGEKTPAAVVEQEKQRLKDFEQLLAGLREQLKRLDDA